MSQTQRSIILYSLLSLFGLVGAVLIAMFVAILGAFALGTDWMAN